MLGKQKKLKAQENYVMDYVDNNDYVIDDVINVDDVIYYIIINDDIRII